MPRLQCTTALSSIEWSSVAMGRSCLFPIFKGSEKVGFLFLNVQTESKNIKILRETNKICQ